MERVTDGARTLVGSLSSTESIAFTAYRNFDEGEIEMYLRLIGLNCRCWSAKGRARVVNQVTWRARLSLVVTLRFSCAGDSLEF